MENQIAFYTDYVRSNPYWKLVAAYADSSSGLRIKSRPGYQQLLKDCKRKKIDLILVKSLSRFDRDAQETITMIRRLKSMGIGVYVELGEINTLTTPDMRPIQPATSMALSWRQSLPLEMYMTAWRLMKCMTV